MSTGLRRPLYFSEVKDKDILDYIAPLLIQYSFSSVIRELVRDGIRFRERKRTDAPVLQSNTKNLSSSLDRIELPKKEVSDSEIVDKFDSF